MGSLHTNEHEEANGESVSHHFALAHPAADGHFPGNPIIPGAMVLREVIASIDAAPGASASGWDIRSAKFHQPVRPGDTLAISWRVEVRGEVRFACVIAGADRPAVTGVLRRREP